MVKCLDREQIASDTIGRQAWVRLKCYFFVMINRIADWKAAETTVLFATNCEGEFGHVFTEQRAKQCFRR